LLGSIERGLWLRCASRAVEYCTGPVGPLPRMRSSRQAAEQWQRRIASWKMGQLARTIPPGARRDTLYRWGVQLCWICSNMADRRGPIPPGADHSPHPTSGEWKNVLCACIIHLWPWLYLDDLLGAQLQRWASLMPLHPTITAHRWRGRAQSARHRDARTSPSVPAR